MNKIKIDTKNGIVIEVNKNKDYSKININNNSIVFEVFNYENKLLSKFHLSFGAISFDADDIEFYSDEIIIDIVNKLDLELNDTKLIISDGLNIYSNSIVSYIDCYSEIKASKIIFE